jgi:hypothetical protein
VSDFIVFWFLVWHFLHSDLEADLSEYRACDFTSRCDCILRGDYFARTVSCQMKIFAAKYAHRPQAASWFLPQKNAGQPARVVICF